MLDDAVVGAEIADSAGEVEDAPHPAATISAITTYPRKDDVADPRDT